MEIGPNIGSIIKQRLKFSIANISKQQDIMFAAALFFVLSFLIFPVAPSILDFLLSISIALSALILLTVLFIDKPLDFSAFPSILLIVTLFRLALNISTTRLILSDGHLGPSAAGHVVEAFGYFVMQGSVVIGAIVFGILTIINFVVITKGSGRIAEVAARFSLDAMPGKQMSIDADLSAGLLDEKQARDKRKDLEDENTFFGSMDGANKFVRGDAIAGLLITFINLIAGIIIGVIQKDMSFNLALKTYTLLTIGDGLVAQIPALIVSISAGLLVTKSGARGSAEKPIFVQLSKHPQALASCSVLLIILGIMPGIPLIPFAMVSAICATLAFFLYKKKMQTALVQSELESHPVQKELTQEESIIQSLHIDYIKIELGYELLQMVDNNKEYKLTDQIKSLRKQIAKDLGFILPSVRIQDNMQLDSRTYTINIKDIECGKGVIQPLKILVINPSGGSIDIEGEDTIEPTFGLNAKWVDRSAKEEAVFKEYTVIEPVTVISTHLTEIVKENITELLTYAETKKLLNNLDGEHKKLGEEVVPEQISVVAFQRILQNLLNESVTIKDLPSILEAISEISDNTKNIARIVEHIRTRLSKQISHSLINDEGFIPILLLSSYWEQAFVESLVGEDNNKHLAMQPTKLHEFVNAINMKLDELAASNTFPALLTTPMLRPFVRSVTERFKPSLVILSKNEIHPKVKIKNYGNI
ncbi:MAG: flagellar biosynthesis protein FlhA [Candidatus Midichloriaceae bacterium]|jgi:flagellar biosynthesis protein FlhA